MTFTVLNIDTHSLQVQNRFGTANNSEKLDVEPTHWQGMIDSLSSCRCLCSH